MYTTYTYTKGSVEPLTKDYAFTYQEALKQIKEDICMGYTVKIYDGNILIKEFN
jgi:hypothetical protein